MGLKIGDVEICMGPKETGGPDNLKQAIIDFINGAKKKLDIAVQEIGQVVEGFNTAREVVQLALDFKVDMPISEQVYRVLHEGLSPEAAVHNLLARDIRRES